MFEKFKKIGTWFKIGSNSKGESILKTTTGLGAVGYLTKFIHEAVQENSNKAVLKESGIGFLALALAFLGLDTLEGKRTESNNKEKNRVKSHADKSEAEKYQSKCQAEADAYAKKRQADAEKYRAEAETDVWKAEAMKRIRNNEQENLTTEEPMDESPASNPKGDETFMQSFSRKLKFPPMPPIIDDVLAGCPESAKMPLLLATLSEFGALCFPRVITEGWRGETHRANIQVVIEGPAGVGKGRIFKAYKTMFQRIIAKDEAKGREDQNKNNKHQINQ